MKGNEYGKKITYKAKFVTIIKNKGLKLILNAKQAKFVFSVVLKYVFNNG